MAAGTVLSSAGGSPAVIASNSCADVMAGVTQLHAAAGVPQYVVASCTSDPVVVGTRLDFTIAGVYWDIIQISATPSTATPSTTPIFKSDFDSDLAAGFFAAALMPILILYFSSKGIGELLKFLKEA
jgi:hypothetical protein